MPVGVYKRTKKIRKQISESLKGRKLSQETINKMSLSKKGKKTWNTGLTKESDIRVAANGLKIGKVNKGKKNALGYKFTQEQRKNSSMSKIGRIVSEETKKKTRETKKRKILNGELIINSGHFPSAGYREDIDLFVRSKWEANIIRILKYLYKDFEYESKKCKFNTTMGVLILDLYLPKDNLWIEIKGRLYEKSRNKMNEFVNLYPDEAKNTFIIDKKAYKILTNKFSSKIVGWES
jgi:phosphopantetheine adenylyltransferase